MDSFKKLRIAMRYRLRGMASIDRRYQVALDAFYYAETALEGQFRKDKVTPTFMHPLGVLAYLMTMLPLLRHPAETLATALLHDCMEDCGLTRKECLDRFGPMVTGSTVLMSKKVEGVSLTLPQYFANMEGCPITTVLKPTDRVNNQGAMVGVFTPEKIREYVLETEQYILPMLRKSRSRFSDQELVYENLKLILTNQNNLFRAYVPELAR
ncbi:HD domain-containing protein [Nostoc sp. CHAB 5834]|nr:HD domain-containing protein [Nostoc sp. CHAB 5834]